MPATQYSFKTGTVNQLQLKLIEELEEQVPDSLKFEVGYCDGKHQMSLVSGEDLKAMYSKHRLGDEVISATCLQVIVHLDRVSHIWRYHKKPLPLLT